MTEFLNYDYRLLCREAGSASVHFKVIATLIDLKPKKKTILHYFRQTGCTFYNFKFYNHLP